MENEKLILTIDTKEPIPLEQFYNSLKALHSEFDTVNNKSSKLFVREIRNGSYIIEFISTALIATLPILPIIETTNSLVQFVEYLKISKDWLLGNTSKPKEIRYSAKELNEIGEVLKPIIVLNDNASMNFYCGVDHRVDFSKNEAIKIFNQVKKETLEPTEVLQIQDESNMFYQKVLFYWYQTRFDSKQINTGNKGIIEKIDKKPKNIIFANDDSDTKKEMTTMHPEIKLDWQKVGYIVDVEVMNANNEIKCYKILKNYMEDCIVE